MPHELPPPPREIETFFAAPERFRGDLGGLRSPLLFKDGARANTPAEWRRRRAEILAEWHGFLGPWPEPIATPPKRILASQRRGAIVQERLQTELIPGRPTDDCYLLTPPGKGPFPAALVVYYDGLTGVGQNQQPLRDYAWQLAQRGFVALSLGCSPFTYYPSREQPRLQTLSLHAYQAANARRLLAGLPNVDGQRIGVVGHSYGGKWALLAMAFDEGFAAGAWSDPGILFDDTRPNINYWDPWYFGLEPGKERPKGLPTAANPAIGPYRRLRDAGRDLHELLATLAPRPFLVSGGTEDPPARWRALHHAVAANALLGVRQRVAMTNRPAHDPTAEHNAVLYRFFEWALAAKPA